MESREDRIVERLLEDINLESRQIYFGTDGAFTCFSDGHFLERPDALPPAIDQLRYQFPNTLIPDAIRQVIPRGADQSGEIPRSIEEDEKRYKLLCKQFTCVVAGVCFDYLKIRYPEARVYCSGRHKPVVFIHGEIVRAVLMPIKT